MAPRAGALLQGRSDSELDAVFVKLTTRGAFAEGA
jgi:hypothetical protein